MIHVTQPAASEVLFAGYSFEMLWSASSPPILQVQGTLVDNLGVADDLILFPHLPVDSSMQTSSAIVGAFPDVSPSTIHVHMYVCILLCVLINVHGNMYTIACVCFGVYFVKMGVILTTFWTLVVPVTYPSGSQFTIVLSDGITVGNSDIFSISSVSLNVSTPGQVFLGEQMFHVITTCMHVVLCPLQLFKIVVSLGPAPLFSVRSLLCCAPSSLVSCSVFSYCALLSGISCDHLLLDHALCFLFCCHPLTSPLPLSCTVAVNLVLLCSTSRLLLHK